MAVRQPGGVVFLAIAALLMLPPPPVLAAPASDPEQELRVLHSLVGKLEKQMADVGRAAKSLDKVLTNMEAQFSVLHQNVTTLERHRDDLMDTCAPPADTAGTATTSGPVTTAQREGPRVRDCEELLPYGIRDSGVYTIYVDNQPVRVFCRFVDGSEAWTVIQRRQDGSVNFNRSWADYKEGFGDPGTEYWLGNEIIHQLTTGRGSSAMYKLYIYMEDWEGGYIHIQFDEFYLESEATNYKLRLNLLRGGNTRNAMYSNTGQPFTTYDRDNDAYGANCGKRFGGGWWYYGHACVYANLNGLYRKGGETSDGFGLVWLYWRSPVWYSAKVTEMRIMIRDASIPVRQP
ncbi:PREDICTED: microfibril-associated glycoprotein 4-like [Branchiostoma belcheri]|uniref:Microfibril-associated glycoprotein 4-like n=1 Tax=Branchiostoma belcheri TaxID=7741 RepID=A0A6P5AA52_BRABE|nr:PREDICTED: microfibril-associated glycoprotein 4-like [Branchiostoma belcheri]